MGTLASQITSLTIVCSTGYSGTDQRKHHSSGHRWIPAQRPVTRSFDFFFALHLNKQLSKQSRRRWFETPSAHYDVTVTKEKCRTLIRLWNHKSESESEIVYSINIHRIHLQIKLHNAIKHTCKSVVIHGESTTSPKIEGRQPESSAVTGGTPSCHNNNSGRHMRH